MAYSLQSAATACGVNRSTILRAIKSGKISASKDAAGAWLIEPVECHRVYPPVALPHADAVAVPDRAPPDALADALVSELRRAISDLQQDRDAWREQAQRLAIGAPVQTPKPVMGWWRWLRSTG